MAFGFAGAGAGSVNALEDILKEQMVRAQMAQREKEHADRMGLEQSQLAEAIRRSGIAENQAQQRVDLDASVVRDRSNQRGVRRMLGEAIVQRQGPITPEDRRGLAALQVEAGDEPSLLNEPQQKPPGTHVVSGNLVDDTGKVLFSAPKEADKPREVGPFVVGGNLVDSSGKVIFRGQDASAQGPSPYAQERASRTIQSVDELIGKVGGWTAGYGSLLSNLPETDARAFRGALDTLKANIAFNELTAMREASKTGGALGSVAVREMELLQAALGALDQAQSPDDLKAQLQKVKSSVEQWQQAGGRPPIAPATSREGVPAASAPASAPGTTPKRMRFDSKGNPKP